MESKYGNEKIIFIFFCCLFLFTTCAKKEKAEIDPLLLSDIRNGDIICRLGNGFFSNRFKDYSSTEKIYSHAGIIQQSGDSLFVIHAEASELTGIGFVKREPVSVFLDDIRVWGVYRTNADDSVRNRIAVYATEYFERKTSFDLEFNAYDDSKVYCTQLVALAVNKAFGDSIIKPALNIRGHVIYGIDNVYLLPDIQVIVKIPLQD